MKMWCILDKYERIHYMFDANEEIKATMCCRRLNESCREDADEEPYFRLVCVSDEERPYLEIAP